VNFKLSPAMVKALKSACRAYTNPIAIGYIGGVEQRTIDALVARGFAHYIQTKTSKRRMPVLTRKGWDYCKINDLIGDGELSTWNGYARMLERTYVLSGGDSWVETAIDAGLYIYRSEA